MRIGILGGSFDPVHYGHLLLAECCREDCQLDQVWFVPTAISPHKLSRAPAPAKARIAMLELVAGGRQEFVVCQLEALRGGISYTVDTLEMIASQQPEADLFFLLGADALQDLPRWLQPARICQLALPVVIRRGGLAEPNWELLQGIVPENRLMQARQHQVQMPGVDLSSSEIRRRVRTGLSIRYQTPRAVEMYIQTHGLYRDDVTEG
jgi:nicotinate-nucleotide adenylyltransferase